MNPMIAAIAVGSITALGRWARGKELSIDIVIGIVGVALGLTILQGANEKLARTFGVLIVVGVAFAHAGVVLDKAQGVKPERGSK